MSAADSNAEPQQQPALRVQDALGYLDQVKSKFNDQPFVYNQFLDIMKDFKSQAIDTPGVIDKVSTLFRGHTDLIVGFNQFLPPAQQQAQQLIQQPPPSQPQTQPQIQPQPQAQPQAQPPAQTQAQPQAQPQTQPQAQPQTQPQTQSQNQPQIQQPQAQQQTQPQTQPQIQQPQAQQQAQQLAPQQPSGAQPEFGFSHALNYVNKIKHRFSANPEIYQQFLEILHTYQRDQHATDVPRPKMLLESEVYNQVARLFQNQRDLLEEFSQFLPDAKGTGTTGNNINSLTRVHHQMSPNSNVNSNSQNIGMRHLNDSSIVMSTEMGHVKRYINDGSVVINAELGPVKRHINDGSLVINNELASMKRHINDGSVVMNNEMAPVKRQNSRGGNHQNKISMKRQNNSANLTYNSTKRPRMTSLRDVSLAEAGKHGSLVEYAFFDKVRKALKSTEVYENFLRCLVLYNHEIVSRTELIGLANNFIGRFPDLMKWFKEFLGFRDGAASINQALSMGGVDNLSTQPAQNRQRERDRISSEAGTEIDYSSCKRHGASYRGLPKSFVQPKCTGRTALCKEVLNDTLVSFPSWSEDSTFVSSRKTQYEEYIYRCEDERFELDIVIESNLLTIRVLEAVRRKIDKMSLDERNRFKLDDTLGGTSCVIHQRAIRRIYGDKAPEMIEGLKKNPVIAVPLVLRRLKAKDEEWRDAQKQFNKIWREQNEKYYLKSLDHQGTSFKQNDIKYLRSKSLIKEIEDLQRENQDDDLNASSAGGGDMVATTELSNSAGLPHITLVYKDKDMLDEACNLIIHHVKRQTSIHKDEKQKIKQLMRQFIPDLFFAPRGELSDDELDENDDQMEDEESSEKRYDSVNENGRKSFDNRLHHKNDIPSSPKTNSRLNRESPKLSCDESPLKDPELGEPIRPEQQKYLSDIESPTKDEAIAISLEGRERTNLEPLSIITENSNNKEGDYQNPHSTDTQQKDASSFIKSPQQALQNKDPEDSYQMFYVDDKWYCFLRLHHILCQRLGSIYHRSKVLIAEEEKERKDRKESTAIALRLKPRNDIEVEDYFPVFVDMIKQLLDGNLDGNQYEDMLRDMYGIYAYVAFTMDKVVQNIVRQLQHMVGDEVSQQCTDLFLEETKQSATGGPCATAQSRAIPEANYLKRAEQLLEDENCYKVTIYKNESKLTIGLLDTETNDDSDNEDPEDKWSSYLNKEFSKDTKSRSSKQWFLTRNVRRYMAREEKLMNLTASKEAKTGKDPQSNNETGGEDKPCSFNPDKYRRLLVFNNNDHVFFYRHNRPTKVRQTAMADIKRKKFKVWTNRWVEINLSSEQIKRGIEWLGKTDSNPTNQKS